MKFVFIMNPLADVKAYKDTSYLLKLAAHQRGHDVYHLDQSDIYLDHNKVRARVTPVEVHDDFERPFTIHYMQKIDLAQVDVIFIRTDPPFDRRYFYTTLLLEYLPDSVKVINKPQILRDWNEKLAALFYPGLTPKTLVSNCVEEIGELLTKHHKLTIKPIDGHGGQGIIFIESGDNDWQQKVNDLTHQQSQWVVAQEYLPEAENGDKRILLIEGEPIGAILRMHAKGQALNNLDAGGTAHPCELDENDWQICRALNGDLIKKDVFFCGIDVIGGKLIEINVTSPTGLRELVNFSGRDYHLDMIKKLEAH